MIDQFLRQYAFLSNFYPSQIKYGVLVYPTIEHAYQAAKTLDQGDKELIAELPTPGQAKRIGQTVELREDWAAARLHVMGWLVRLKFADPKLRALLLSTGEVELIEGNTWGDRFWGVCNGRGSNHLGKLLMTVRSELRERGRVVHCRREECDVLIDRSTRLRNPFTIGMDGTRENVIVLYEAHAREMLRSGTWTREQVLALRGKRLGCWCAPRACHGDVLLNIAEELYNESLF